MSFFKKVLSSVGIGAAKVDTILLNESCEPGGELEATVMIQGGDIEQQIDSIYFSVHCHYIKEIEDDKVRQTATLASFKIAESLTIAPNEQQEFPVQLTLPEELPLTLGHSKVWLSTGLDIAQALDPGDKDYLNVHPNDLQQAVFEAVEQLGFSLVQVENEAARFGRQPFIQEFEFKPTAGHYAGRLDELEIFFLPNTQGMELFMEIDRKARGLGGMLAEMMDLDESKVRVQLTQHDIPTMTEMLDDIISRHC